MHTPAIEQNQASVLHPYNTCQKRHLSSGKKKKSSWFGLSFTKSFKMPGFIRLTKILQIHRLRSHACPILWLYLSIQHENCHSYIMPSQTNSWHQKVFSFNFMGLLILNASSPKSICLEILASEVPDICH